MKSVRKAPAKSKTSEELTDELPVIAKTVEEPIALPPLPATAEIYAGINDVDVLLHRAFELRKRMRFYQTENALVTAELVKRLGEGRTMTSRYRAVLSIHKVRQFTVPNGIRTQVSIERLHDTGGAR